MLIRLEPLAWFSKNMMIRYVPLQTWKASQPLQAISLAVKNRIANEIEGYIFTSLTRMTARLICILAAIFSSPEHKVLMVSDCGQSMSVVRRAASTIALKAYSSYTLGPIDLILGRKHQGDL